MNSVCEVHDGEITVWRDYFDVAPMAKIQDPNAEHAARAATELTLSRSQESDE